MTSPQLLLESLEKSLKEWEIFGRRAQLEAIMPIVDSLTQHKVSCTVLAKMLAERNCEIKADTLRQSLHRWRKKQTSHAVEVETDTESPISASAAAGALSGRGAHPGTYRADKSQASAVRQSTAKPLTKAGLAEIRDSHIDLDEIKRLARQTG